MRQFEAKTVKPVNRIGLARGLRLYEQAVDELWTSSDPRKTQSLRIRILFNKDLFKGSGG